MKYVIYIFLFLYSFQGFSQAYSPEEQNTIDSLNRVINDPSSHDTTKALMYLHLSGILYVANMDTMIPLCNKIIYLADDNLLKNPPDNIKNTFLRVLSGAYNNIGFVYWSKGNIEKALFYLHLSLEQVKKEGNKKGLAIGLNNIGSIYENQGNIGKALDYMHKSLRLEEELGDKDGIATSLHNIAGIYKDQGDSEKAMDYYNKGLALLTEVKNRIGMASSYNSIGSLYDDMGDKEKALEFYFKALNIQKEIGNKPGKSNCLNNIGFIYFEMGDIDNALVYYYKSLEIREVEEDKDGIIGSSLGIAKALLSKGNATLAKKYALNAFKLSKEIGFPKHIKPSAQILSEIFEKENNKSEALEMLKLFITMSDSINNEDTKKATLKEQAKYEYEKQKLIDDSKHDKLIAIEKEEKEKQQILIYAIVFGLILVIIFLLFVFNRLKITRKQKNTIEQAHIELEEKNEEILDSITYAKRIQSAILPSDEVVKEYLQDSFIIYKPKDIVAGDFYWMEQRDGKVLFAAADCTGHGVPGAMVSVVCNNALNRSVREHGILKPSKILDKSREIVISEFKKSLEEVHDGMDIALCSLDLKTNCLEYSGANNPLWIIRNNSTEIEEIKGTKQPVGKAWSEKLFENHKLSLNKGDAIYIFSDGYADQFGGEKGKKFKSKAFKELILHAKDKSMEEQKAIIDEFFENWKGNLDQIDDVCIIGVRI